MIKLAENIIAHMMRLPEGTPAGAKEFCTLAREQRSIRRYYGWCGLIF
jgi:hypothetical protein